MRDLAFEWLKTVAVPDIRNKVLPLSKLSPTFNFYIEFLWL